MDELIAVIKQNVLLQLISWQFLEVPKEILKAWKNFLKFNLEYFSIPLLLKTYLSYWRGYKWSYGRGFDLGVWVEAAVSNAISKILGAFLRTFPLIIGIITEVVIFFLGLIFFFSWFFLPIIFIVGIFYGLKFL